MQVTDADGRTLCLYCGRPSHRNGCDPQAVAETKAARDVRMREALDELKANHALRGQAPPKGDDVLDDEDYASEGHEFTRDGWR